MPISIHVRSADVDSSAVARGVEEAFDLVYEADRLFSTYQHDREVSRIRRSELDSAQADPLVGQVITLCNTLVGPSLMWADVWATALFVGPASLPDRFTDVADGYRVIRL
jgi:thiamine biosynthesis lipoprotein ApbE